MSKKKFHFLIIVVATILTFLFIFCTHYVCPFKYFLNIWCAGCGGTRMIKAIFKLDFYQAFRYNPLLFILLILGIIFIVIDLIVYIKKKSFIKIPLKFWICLILLLVVYMILRNIPMFSYLIPTEV